MSTIKGSVSAQLSTASCVCGGSVRIESKQTSIAKFDDRGLSIGLSGQRVTIWCTRCDSRVSSPLLSPRRAITNATQSWAELQRLTRGERPHGVMPQSGYCPDCGWVLWHDDRNTMTPAHGALCAFAASPSGIGVKR